MKLQIKIENKKEAWANNFEREQKSHTLTMEELVKSQTKIKELENTVSNLQITLKSVQKLNTD